MKRILFLAAFLLSAMYSHAHEYFFAFAEIEYRQSSRCFEITIEGSAHDVKDVLVASGVEIRNLEEQSHDSAVKQQLENFVTAGFQMSSGNKECSLHLIGYEVLPNGLIYFYLTSDPIELNTTVEIRFDWLMDDFPQQQNKITLIIHGKKNTAVFLPHQRKTSISLSL